MEWDTIVIVYVIIPIVSGVIGFLASLCLQRLRHKDEKELKLFDKKFDKFNEFLDSRGLKTLLKYCEDDVPAKLLKHAPNFSQLIQQIEKQEEKLNTIERLVTTSFNPVTGRIHKHIESNDLFIRRLEDYQQSKLYLMEHITKFPDIKDVFQSNDSIFVESGSTLAYCFLKTLDDIRKWRKQDDNIKPLRVCTNNISIYMILLFEKDFEPILLPGKPDNQYGATFADIAVDGTHGNAVKRFLLENRVTALFTTASKLDIIYGPHVSSTQNHTMKRILNEYADEYKYHNIFIIVAEKINNEVSDGKIHDNCKLIEDTKRTDKVIDHPDVLEKAKKAWTEHLRKKHNYIITGSCQKELCHSTIEELQRVYSFIVSYDLEFERGQLAELRNRI